MDDLKYFLELVFKVFIPLFLVIGGVFYLVSSCHEETEESPYVGVKFTDLQYKGHTYIYVSATYSHTLVHAAHCKCHQNK